MLANQVAEKYRDQKCTVLALNDGGVMVGAQIAQRLHCLLTLLISAEISLPREPDALAGITFSGSMAYNSHYSKGEIDEMLGEYHGLVEQEKMERMHDMNHLLGQTGVAGRAQLEERVVIVVTDGLKSGFMVDLAYEFLKPIAFAKLVIAVPFASVPAVDRMHIIADDIYCLSVIEDYIDTDHYYEKQDVPDHQTVVKTVEEIAQHWQ